MSTPPAPRLTPINAPKTSKLRRHSHYRSSETQADYVADLRGARAFTLAIPNRNSLESICALAQIGVPRAREKWSEWLDILRKVGQSSLPNVWMRLERNALPQLPQ